MTSGSAAGNIPARGTGLSTLDAAADSPVGGGSYVPPAAPLGKAPALRDTFGQTGARVAAISIAIVAVLGVFAPFLANSHPILFRAKGGGLTSPLINSLGPV